MTAFVGRIENHENWWDREYARSYQAEQLGRLNGETYLTEIMPLPKSSITSWPYGELYDSPKKYFLERFPYQSQMIRTEYARSRPKPEFVFCYGKSYWDRHEEIFDSVGFAENQKCDIRWARNEDTIFILTKFFSWRLGWDSDLVDRICTFALEKSPRNH